MAEQITTNLCILLAAMNCFDFTHNLKQGQLNEIVESFCKMQDCKAKFKYPKLSTFRIPRRMENKKNRHTYNDRIIITSDKD